VPGNGSARGNKRLLHKKTFTKRPRSASTFQVRRSFASDTSRLPPARIPRTIASSHPPADIADIRTYTGRSQVCRSASKMRSASASSLVDVAANWIVTIWPDAIRLSPLHAVRHRQSKLNH